MFVFFGNKQFIIRIPSISEIIAYIILLYEFNLYLYNLIKNNTNIKYNKYLIIYSKLD